MTALHSEEYRRFIQAMVAARNRAGISQAELSQRVDLDQSKIAKYETGVRRLDVIEFIKLTSALGLDPAAFLREFIDEESRRT